MGDVRDEAEESASAYEALVEFLYLAPVGIVKFLPDGSIEMANPTAAQLLMPLAPSGDLSNLYNLLADLAPDLQSHVQRYEEPAGQIFDQMQLKVPSTGATLMLDINKINSDTLMAVLQNITDLTEARREVLRKTESQRLLASVFMRLGIAVAVLRADGFILLTNAAFQALLGYDAKSLTGLNIDALLPPESTAMSRAARSRQMLDGVCYEAEIEVMARDGTRSAVVLNSSVLKESETRSLRVVTLTPTHGLEQAVSPSGATPVRTLDLSPFKQAVGPDWPFIADRALSLCEPVVRSTLGPMDVVKQGRDGNFVIWFGDSNPTRIAALLAKAEQGVRRVLVTEFGSKVAERVRTARAA